MPEEIPKEAMRAMDRLYWTTKERASSVHALIGGTREELRKQNVREGRDPEDDIPSDMDLLCYAIEYIGSMAIALGDEEFLLLAQHINIWLQSVHYSNPGRLWGEPDRKEEEDGIVQESESEVCGSDGGGTGDGSVGGPRGDPEVQGNSEDAQDGDVPDDDAV